jgi:D-serine deaminase-like pyridoxal phosphate-dependent protein
MSALPSLENVVTPSLLVDGPQLTENIVRMAARTSAAGVELWPHTKTHKSREIARLQREHGAAGLTVATAREAACFGEAGFEKILVAYPPVGDWRLEALTELAEIAELRVVLDGLEIVALLDDACRRSGVTIRYLWEVDCGVHRCGTEPGLLTAQLINQAVQSFSHALFDGLMTFGGHAYLAPNPAGIVAAAQDEKTALSVTAESLGALDIHARARSAGTTPTAHQLVDAGPITEFRPGNYVFYDATQVTLGVAKVDDCALSVLATVVARPDPRRVILDCGSKALAAERLSPRSQTFGLVVGHPELRIERLFEEHAILTAEEPTGIRLGDRVRVIPNHSCATINLHSRMLITDSGDVSDVWPIDARGWNAEAGSLSHPASSAPPVR